MQVSVCLEAILILEYLDFHSGYSAPRSGIAGRARIKTSLSRCKQRWRHVQVKVLRLLREGRAFGGAQRTLQLISQYREHERQSRFFVEEKVLEERKGI